MVSSFWFYIQSLSSKTQRCLLIITIFIRKPNNLIIYNFRIMFPNAARSTKFLSNSALNCTDRPDWYFSLVRMRFYLCLGKNRIRYRRKNRLQSYDLRSSEYFGIQQTTVQSDFGGQYYLFAFVCSRWLWFFFF